MDTPGRSELMGMQSSLAYQGCPVCLHTWSPGSSVGQTQCVCDGYRRYLAEDSAVRETRFSVGDCHYEYRHYYLFLLLLL